MTRTSPTYFLVLGLWLAFVFVSPAAGVAQSLFSVRPDSAGSLLGGDTALEDDTFGDTETDPDVTDESLEMRMRYPELYDSGLTPDLERSATPRGCRSQCGRDSGNSGSLPGNLPRKSAVRRR